MSPSQRRRTSTIVAGRTAPTSQRPAGGEERGAAVVEFAIVVTLLLAILAGMIDYGFAFNSSRHAEGAVRTAARQGAAAGEQRLADLAVLRAVNAAFVTRDDRVLQVTVYRVASGSDGSIPSGCGQGSPGITGVCNVYTPAQVASLTASDFSDPACAGEPDELWCPANRPVDNDAGALLGVAIWVQHDSIFDLTPNSGLLVHTAAFRMEIPA